MNRHALAVLEFPRVLEEVASHARSNAGAERVRALVPRSDRSWIELEHARVAAVRALRAAEPPWIPDAVPDLSEALQRLGVAGLSLSAAELLGGLQLLGSSRRTREALRDEKRPATARAQLAALVDSLLVDRGLERSLEAAIDESAQVRDDASPALRRLRRELRAAEGDLVRLLEGQLAKLDPSYRVPDMSVTVRNGRYVLPVRREGRSRVGGIVHDSSASGATLFVEPTAAVEFGNRIRELEAEERSEVERILAELTGLLRPCREQLSRTLDALAELDSLHARAVYADSWQCATPAFTDAGQGWDIRQGRHPLLLIGGIQAVPFDLDVPASERTIVVSGPNTGGKTVLLKAVGLTSAMAQAGIPPVCAGCRLPVFDDCFADIGDEQSIAASLSTFSAHLRNLGEILEGATAASLVLSDELGSGTDPLEGAALGWAILEELTARGTFTMATSHLGALKELAAQVAGVVNASLQFDSEHLAPTYKFLKGVPGRSFGIAIARRLKMPEGVVARAEARVPQGERDAAALVERLERQQEALDERERELEAMLSDARKRILAGVEREQRLRERERALELESRSQARKYLLDARSEIDRTVRELKAASQAELDERARAARRHAEELAARQAGIVEELRSEERSGRRGTAAGRTGDGVPREGDLVALQTLGGKLGRVMEVRGDEARVAVGSLKVLVPTTTLIPKAREELEAAVPWHHLPEERVRGEIDLRGMRADEASAAVLQALDDAVRAALPALRIIHGKGTGALRERVAEALAGDARVRQFRLGAWNEGGAGVTVAELE